jgi:SAM-dependent methyltransferase
METAIYSEKLKQQIEQYRAVADIHELPEIFHYWSNKYLRPRLNAVMSADSIAGFYAEHFRRAATRGRGRFLSLGAGDCSLEIEIARHLLDQGLSAFEFDCLELSPALIERAHDAIRSEKLDGRFNMVQDDVNSWSPSHEAYDGVMANHALHHFLELESIFDQVSRDLGPGGVFVTNDIVGRNGHMRWPEVLHYLNLIWAFLPDRFKYNHQLSSLDKEFLNWDCSTEGFEGIRAQDILPLLCARFRFTHFLAYGGLIDVFVDRSYGPNLDAKNPADTAFIDFIQELNDLLIEGGMIKPTMIFAVMSRSGEGRPNVYREWMPEFCVRKC